MTIFDSKNVKDFINDYLANFIRSLSLSIPHYKSIENQIKKEFSSYKFKKEVREQRTLR